MRNIPLFATACAVFLVQSLSFAGGKLTSLTLDAANRRATAVASCETFFANANFSHPSFSGMISIQGDDSILEGIGPKDVVTIEGDHRG